MFMPMYRKLNHEFFSRWSPDMAYVLGFFAADGSMIRNTRGAHFIEFTIVDRIVLECIRRAVGSNHAITKRDRNPLHRPAYRLQIGSKRWFADISALGFTPNKSKTICFPKVPSIYLGDFIRGYFDGDGGAYLGKYWSEWHKKRVWVFTSRFTSGCQQFLSDLQKELHGLGLKGGYISAKKSGYDLVFSRHDSIALYHLMYHTAQVSPLYLSRKRKVLERAIRVLKLNKMRE